MPFRIDLSNIQNPKVWTSDSETPLAYELQRLYDSEDSEAYAKKLAELRAKIVEEEGPTAKDHHDFRLTDGKIFEIWDKNVKQAVSIQFMVKGSVITWSFNAPKDVTQQSWRDEVFNTAAIAHQSVGHGCETYYRGSNAYHLKKMHSHRGESDYNHNHYRLKQDMPLTPKEVEEHLRAFYNQKTGKKFLPHPGEVESIINKYKIYWAEYDLDPRYSKYYPLVDSSKRRVFFDQLLAATNPKQQDEAVHAFLSKLKVNIGPIPKADTELTKALIGLGTVAAKDIEKLRAAMERAASSEFKDLEDVMDFAVEARLHPPEKYAAFILSFNEVVSKANFTKDFEVIKGKMPPDDNEVSEEDDYTPYPSVDVQGPHSRGSSPSSSVSSGSPSDQYDSAIDQIMTWDDDVEFKLFAEALTNRCRSIDDVTLGTLRPDEFRKALRLYNAMKCLNDGKVKVEGAGARFSEELYTSVTKMRSEINGMVSVEEDPGAALAPFFKWIKTAPPKLEEWLAWVETNGSRGLGAEIAHTREQHGSRITRSSFFVPMDDRGPKAEVASVFNLKAKSNSPEDKLAFTARQYLQSIMHLLGDEKYLQKSKVADVVIDILEGRKSIDKLQPALEANAQWDEAEKVDPIIKGTLTDLVAATQMLKAPPTATATY